VGAARSQLKERRLTCCFQGIVDDIRTCITSDLKTEGNLLYLIGKPTEKELGGSEYYKYIKVEGGAVPKTDPVILQQCMKGLLHCMKKGYIAACHDLSEGGLAVCVSEMSIGGDLGATIDISTAPPGSHQPAEPPRLAAPRQKHRRCEVGIARVHNARPRQGGRRETLGAVGHKARWLWGNFASAVGCWR
jgi:hypothetical protein